MVFNGLGATTKTIDYAVNDFVKSDSMNCDSVTVHVSRKGEMAIPNDVEVEFVSGLVKQYHIPLLMSRGHKPLDSSVILLEPWSWLRKTIVLTFVLTVMALWGLLLTL